MIYRDEFGEIRDVDRLVADQGFAWLEFCEGWQFWLGSHLANVEVLPDSGERLQTAETEQSAESWECPMCGALGGEPVEWDLGMDQETGYADRGTGCTQCVKKGRR